jgi:hypothetical protein
VGILRHGGPLLVECLGGCPTPTTWQASGGDRHLNFYGDRDNLLRYAYAANNPEGVAISHHNLADYLERAGDDPADALAHELAAGLITYQMGSGRFRDWLRGFVGVPGRLGEVAPVPASFGELCAQVGQIEGVRLEVLVAGLPGRATDGDQTFAEVLRQARALLD